MLEVRVGRREDADVDRLRAGFADRHYLALLEKAQQLRLNVERQVADLVEEQRAARGSADEALLIRDRAREAAAPMSEQLAVGQVALRRRAVVGEKHRRAPRRADMNGARDEVLAGAAFARDEHHQVMALQPLNLIGDAIHRGARADEPGEQRLERARAARLRGVAAAVARAAQLESLAGDDGEHAETPRGGVCQPMRGDDRAEAWTVVVAAQRLGQQQSLTVGRISLRRRARERACGHRHDTNFADGRHDEDHRRIGLGRLGKRSCRFARQQVREHGCLDEPPDHRIVRIGA